ncbi:MAG: hypothetical protein VX815_13215 [Gemmatimonadota bacterium]|nr:hypothetical protein [Gemmatimonadota bacterium]
MAARLAPGWPTAHAVAVAAVMLLLSGGGGGGEAGAATGVPVVDNETSAEAGLDVKYGITENLTQS